MFIFHVLLNVFTHSLPCNGKKSSNNNNNSNTVRRSVEMQMRIWNCKLQTASVCRRYYAWALVCVSYIFKCLALMAIAVAVTIDKNSLIPNKWAAEARCQVCNGILQCSAVPTGAPVHPNPITYPDSTHFPITGGGKATHRQTGCCHCGIYSMFDWSRMAAYWGRESKAVLRLGEMYESRSAFSCWSCFI